MVLSGAKNRLQLKLQMSRNVLTLIALLTGSVYPSNDSYIVCYGWLTFVCGLRKRTFFCSTLYLFIIISDQSFVLNCFFFVTYLLQWQIQINNEIKEFFLGTHREKEFGIKCVFLWFIGMGATIFDIIGLKFLCSVYLI